MAQRQPARYKRFLIDMPWLRNGLAVFTPPSQAYERIAEHLQSCGFRIMIRDDRLMRLCANREPDRGECSCLHVIWVQRSGYCTYIRYGIEPKYKLFWFCGSGDHLAKLNICKGLIQGALELQD